MWIAVQHRIDFRFIPAEMTFSTPSSSCLTNPDKYQHQTFFTTALQQGKVELTWDEENQERANAIKDAYKLGDWEELENLGDLIASASEDEEDCDNEENAISKYRDLLAGVGDVTEKPSEGDMEVTWNDEGGNENEEELTPVTAGSEDDDVPEGDNMSDPFFAEEFDEGDKKKTKNVKKRL